MTTNFISIRSVLYDLSLTIDDRYWNENKMLEWLIRGYRQINLEPSLEPKSIRLLVEDHKAVLPSDFKYLVQVVEYLTSNLNINLKDQDLPSDTLSLAVISNVPWKPMRLTSNPYHSNICLDQSIMGCTDCGNEFSISPNLTITTTQCTGIIEVAYLGWATSETGDILIPNDESLKEALLHYVMYRYWMSKYTMMEEGAESRMKHHLSMWQVLSMKSKNLNLPDINQLENIKSYWNRLVPRDNKFQQLFLTLGNRENVNF